MAETPTPLEDQVNFMQVLPGSFKCVRCDWRSNPAWGVDRENVEIRAHIQSHEPTAAPRAPLSAVLELASLDTWLEDRQPGEALIECVIRHIQRARDSAIRQFEAREPAPDPAAALQKALDKEIDARIYWQTEHENLSHALDGGWADRALKAETRLQEQTAALRVQVLAVVGTESELEGPMPDSLREAFGLTPEDYMRAAVRATKVSIRAQLAALLAPSTEPQR